MGATAGRVTAALAAAAVLLTAGAQPVAQAQDPRIELADGIWRGTMGAAGVLTLTEDDAFVLWSGSFGGDYVFEVISGTIEGAWVWEGAADLLVTTPEGQIPMELETVGGGPMEGRSDALRLTGEETTTGSGSFMGITSTVGPNTSPIPPIDVRFVEVGCNAVFGDWTTALNDLVVEDGFRGELTGWFIATPYGPTAPGAQIAADLEARYDDLFSRASAALAGGGQALTGSSLLRLFDLLEEAVLLEAEARQLDGTCAYDIGAGPFTTPLTSYIATMLLVRVPALTSSQLFGAAQMLVAAGASGGSASQVLAGQLEAAVAAQAQLLHDQLVTSSGIHPDGRSCSPVDPCVLAPGEVLQLHLAASLLGFTLTIDGLPVDASIAVGR